MLMPGLYLLCRAVHALQQLPTTHGPPGHVITINSPEGSRANPAVWQETQKERWSGSVATRRLSSVSSPSPPAGSGLSEIDTACVAAFAQELASRKIAPHVESRIRLLDQAVLAARRGLRNQLKTLLFRKSSASPQHPSDSPGRPYADDIGSPRARGINYSRTSVEVQMRQLSDLALMVGDCETAMATLRLLASDFKSDKAYLHFAGTQETMAIATVLCDGNSIDAVTSFKEAFYRYNQVASAAHTDDRTATRYATRTAMLAAEYLSSIGRHADASWIVMKAHFQEENLRAALLLEKAAHLLLRVNPPRERKFAFHLVLAGLRYSQGESQELASRTYSQVLEVYRGREWEVVEEHVREALGKACREVGDVTGAVQHFGAILFCPQLPAGLQSLHMNQFAEALNMAKEKLVSSRGIR